MPERILFITGRLAEERLRKVVHPLSAAIGFDYEIRVPGIQVAALLHTGLLKSRLKTPHGFDRVIVPGWCRGDLGELADEWSVPVELGPKDLSRLPEWFGQSPGGPPSMTEFNIEIIAEINHAPLLSVEDLLKQALQYHEAGADVIDYGCIPGQSFGNIGVHIRALKDAGLRVSVDTFNDKEAEAAVAAGAELILSCNHSNLEVVTKLGVEVVAVPDEPYDTESLRRLIDQLQKQGAAFRIDPILEPVGFGFARSLERYLIFRREYPELPMMMGVGNVTELTQADSGGMNMLLAAICEEAGIGSVLTTQVIPWCSHAVAELEVARRMAFHSVLNRTIPKNLPEHLVMLREGRHQPPTRSELSTLQTALKDRNYRIATDGKNVFLFNRDGFHGSPSAFAVFRDALAVAETVGTVPDAAHAFYLGYELARAEVAALLGKRYEQDEVLSFGVAGSWSASENAAHRSASDCDDDRENRQ